MKKGLLHKVLIQHFVQKPLFYAQRDIGKPAPR